MWGAYLRSKSRAWLAKPDFTQSPHERNRILLFLVGDIFEDVGRLAIEGLADGVEGREADGFGVVVFENGEVGKGDANALGELAEGDLAARHHDVKVDEYHGGTSNGKVVFGLDAGGFFDHVFDHAQAKSDEKGGDGGGKGELEIASQRQKKQTFRKGAP